MSLAIAVRGVSKRFRIPLDRSTTLKYRVTHLRSSSRYHDLWALRDVTLDVPAGQFMGVIGANGCGKTTLLKILSKIYVPTSGSILVEGRVSPFLELGVGFNPELTARENVFLNGAILGLTRGELQARFQHIIDFADLREFVDQKLKNFSSGMQVRLAFSVAIEAKAQILLMDEVLAVGDARFQEKCFDVFWRYKREGRTVVLVTHDLSAVENYCDRAILFDHGRIQADGIASEVTATYRRLVDASFQHDRVDGWEGRALTSENGQRWGSGEVIITGVHITDVDGHPVQAVRGGSAIALEIEYEARQQVSDVTCTVTLHRADGLRLTSSNSRSEGLMVPPPAVGERRRVVYQIDRLPLRSGSYAFSVGLYDEHLQHAYDEIRMAYPVRVTDGGAGDGILELTERWAAVGD